MKSFPTVERRYENMF